MLINVFSGSTVPVLEQVVQFSQARHNVLAGNLANMDTPGYKIRDLNKEEFQSRLKDAIDAGHNGGPPMSESSASQTQDAAMRRVKEASRDILYHDQSDLSLEKQVLEIAQNQGSHNTAIAILSSQYRLLNVAISERV